MKNLQTFDDFLNEYNSFRKKEINAGLEDQKGDYYEVEGGELVDVADYNKYEHGEVIGKYNKKGKKIY